MDAVSDAIGDEFIDRLRNQIDKKAIDRSPRPTKSYQICGR